MVCCALLLFGAPRIDHRQAVLQAQTFQEKGQAYRAFFESTPRKDLTSLRNDVDTGIALQAAWELARIPPLVRQAIGERDLSYDPKAIEAFLAFLESRVAIQVPQWWRRTLQGISVAPASRHGFFNIPTDIYQPDGDGMHFTRGVTISKTGETFRATQGQDTTLVPDDCVPREADQGLALDVGPLRSFFLPHETQIPSRAMYLAGFETATGRRLWRAQVWGADDWGRPIGGGKGRQSVTIATSSTMVFVFGVETTGAFAEGFDARSGTALFRFCTSYWGNYSEFWNLKL